MSSLLRLGTALAIVWAFSGCAEQANPPGTGAGGEPLQVAPDGGSEIPEAVKNPQPGSGMGGGGGDGGGRERFPDKGGKADHERGTGSNKRNEKVDAEAKDAPAPKDEAKTDE